MFTNVLFSLFHFQLIPIKRLLNKAFQERIKDIINFFFVVK